MDFRKAVIRLFLFTAFLLLLAWVSLRFMQYRGDWEALLRDGEEALRPVIDFFHVRIMPLLKKGTAFVNEKIVPWVEGLVARG